jgi:CRP-like cAMP-binding protein
MLMRLRPLLAVDAAVRVPAVTVALLRSLHVFRAMPVPALEGVAQAAANLSVTSGEEIIRQGEPGERYYAIADGSVEIRKDGVPVNRLERGEGFGETALLYDAPRSATVVALTDTTLVTVEREPFLVALTGHAQTRERLERVATQRQLDAEPVHPALAALHETSDSSST